MGSTLALVITSPFQTGGYNINHGSLKDSHSENLNSLA